ncbi:MAG: cyclopropane-fatty-acyl-phospholipid synthase family protein [Steroidobacteraceae bacterium]
MLRPADLPPARQTRILILDLPAASPAGVVDPEARMPKPWSRSPASLEPVSHGATATSRGLDQRLLGALLRAVGSPPMELQLGEDGASARPEGSDEPIARVRIRDRAALLDILGHPRVGFADAYADGRVEIEGDLVRLLEAIYRHEPGSAVARFAARLRQRVPRRRHAALASARENIHHHYDIGNAFYSLWLGRTMAYTCAYYPTPEATLDEAQEAKFEHVCRKLQLRGGESVVEAGCGWGGLALHMARRHGVRVRAFNISREQIAYARERARIEGLESEVEFVEDDFRNISGSYDAFVSVGMLEHVGIANYADFGLLIRRCLPRHGRGLIHSIGRNWPLPLHPWITRRIFPGAQPPSISQMMQIFEPADLTVLDVENLRPHYARTLRDRLALYEAGAARIRAMYDERFLRTWRLYLAGSIAAFNTGMLQLFQVVFAPRENDAVPFTRAHLYRD